MARSVLSETGSEVLTAGDGPRGLEVFARRPDEIRLVLLDLTMPEMDGCEVLKAIRENRPETRVILTSGYGPGESRDRSVDDRPDLFLEKPDSPATLVGQVYRVVSHDR